MRRFLNNLPRSVTTHRKLSSLASTASNDHNAESLYRNIQKIHIKEYMQPILQGTMWHFEPETETLYKKTDEELRLITSIPHPFDQGALCHSDDMLHRITKNVIQKKYSDENQPKNFYEPFFGYITRKLDNLFFQMPDKRINLMELPQKEASEHIGENAAEKLTKYKLQLKETNNPTTNYR